MNAEKLLDGLVVRLREAAGENLESIILYGSAATSDFRPGHSDLNVFCVLRDASFAALQAIGACCELVGQAKAARAADHDRC